MLSRSTKEYVEATNEMVRMQNEQVKLEKESFHWQQAMDMSKGLMDKIDLKRGDAAKIKIEREGEEGQIKQIKFVVNDNSNEST